MHHPHHKRVVAALSTAAIVPALLAAAAATAAPAAAATPVIHVTQTSSDLSDHLTPKADITLGPVTTGSQNASINDGVSYQTVDGFGAAFTDTSTYLLSQLPQATRDSVMQQMFSRSNGGVGLSFMRVPMGASDFTATPPVDPQPYSYDDNAGVADPTLANFSIAHDTAYTIPVLKQAQALNPQMKLFANNWSPPGWMKNNGTMYGTGNNTLRSDSYQTLADYYVKFLQAYQAAGVNVWAITPQNEPTISPTTYPSMLFPPADEAAFIKNNLSPALTAAGLDTTIIGGDTDGVWVDYFKTLMSDPVTAAKIGALGAHCYPGNLYNFGTNGGNDLRTLFPDKPRYETECSTGPTGIAPENAAMTTLESMYNGVSGVQLWNVALDPSGGPKIGQGCNGCTGLVTVDPATGSAQFTENFYMLGQFSKFVKPGAVRVGSTDDGPDWGQAFRNTDGSEALVLHNTTTSARTLNITWNGQGSFTYTIGGHSTVTFSTDPTQVSPTLTADSPSATARLGNSYSYQFTATGTPTPSFGFSGNLPPGITLDPSTGKLSGTPTSTGTFTFAVTAANGVAPAATGQNHTITVSNDSGGPSIVPTITGSSSNGWFTTQALIGLTAAESGAKIQYQIDSGAWTAYRKAFPIINDGTHLVTARLTRNGMVVNGSDTSFTVAIDKTAPIPAGKATPSTRGTPRNPVTITLTATDKTSGVDRVQYQLNNGAWNTVTGPLTFDTVGDYVVTYRAVDNAGITSTAKSVRAQIGADPTTRITSAFKVNSGGFATYVLTGYHRYTWVVVKLGDSTLSTTLTDVNGSARLVSQIPSGTPAGTYTVSADDGTVASSTTQTVTTT